MSQCVFLVNRECFLQHIVQFPLAKQCMLCALGHLTREQNILLTIDGQFINVFTYPFLHHEGLIFMFYMQPFLFIVQKCTTTMEKYTQNGAMSGQFAAYKDPFLFCIRYKEWEGSVCAFCTISLKTFSLST